jgi:hypothetical protein
MGNRLFVLTNKLQEIARRRRRSPASAPPNSGPITGIPLRESSRAGDPCGKTFAPDRVLQGTAGNWCSASL